MNKVGAITITPALFYNGSEQLMISTLYFIQFIAFYLWQYTSKHTKRTPVTGAMAKILSDRKLARGIGSALLSVAAIGFIYTWGWLAGICGMMIGLMGMGCLSAVLAPFKYIRPAGIAALYLGCIALEILI